MNVKYLDRVFPDVTDICSISLGPSIEDGRVGLPRIRARSLIILSLRHQGIWRCGGERRAAVSRLRQSATTTNLVSTSNEQL